eukprot:760874-Hanusia_phi.AAC.1
MMPLLIISFFGAMCAASMLLALILMNQSERQSERNLRFSSLLYREPEIQVNPGKIHLAYSPYSVLSTKFCKDTCRSDYQSCGQAVGRDAPPCLYLYIDCIDNDCKDPNWQLKEVCFSSLRNNYLTCIGNNDNIDYCKNVFNIQKEKC